MRHQNIIVRTTALSMMLGFVAWAALLMQASFIVRNMSISSTYVVHGGALALHRIQKVRLPQGYSVHISVEPGFLFFVCGWLALGILSGVCILFWDKKRREQINT